MPREFQMSFEHVVVLPSRATFYITLLKNCGGGDSLSTATCLIAVLGGQQGHTPCKILPFQELLFVSVEFYAHYKAVTKLW